MVTLIYLGISFFCGVGAMLHYSVLTGFIILVASSLAIIATGGTILGARSHGRAYTVGSVVFGISLLGLTYWLSGKFSISLFGHTLRGLTWCLIGCAVGLYWGLASQPEGIAQKSKL
jgi:hypothetical protein